MICMELGDKVVIHPDPGTHLPFVSLIPQNEANSRMCYISKSCPPLPKTFNIAVHFFDITSKRPFVFN